LAALCRRQGAYFRAHSRTAEAEAPLREAVALCEQLVKDDPDNVVDCSALAESYSNLGYLFHYVLIRRWHEAETAYRQALTIQEDVVRRAPANPDYRNVLGRMCRDLGKICMLDRRTEESERAYKRGIDVQTSLARDHPNTSSYQMVLTSLYKELGVVYDTTGRLADALAPWLESLRCAERLVDRDPTDLRHIVSLGEMQAMLGYLQFRLHNDALDAAALVNRGIATLESAYARDSRLQTLQICLKNAYDFRGDMLVSLGRYSEALADRERVIALAEPPFRPFAQIVHAVTLAQSGNDRRAIEEMRTAADAVPRNSPSAGAIYANSARVFAVAAIAVSRDAARSDSERKVFGSGGGVAGARVRDWVSDERPNPQVAGIPPVAIASRLSGCPLWSLGDLFCRRFVKSVRNARQLCAADDIRDRLGFRPRFEQRLASGVEHFFEVIELRQVIAGRHGDPLCPRDRCRRVDRVALGVLQDEGFERDRRRFGRLE
jgi:tetratricopeptide (TPR) repeat protein